MIAIEDIDLNLLRVFSAILEEKSLTRAGERLKLSQPAISYSLGRMRTIFDDPLFVRARTGMQPTERALEISPIIDKALDAVREALRYTEMFDPASSNKTFRILVSDAGEMGYIPVLWERMRNVAPNVKLSVEPMPVELVEDALRTGRLDCAIGNLPSLIGATLHVVLFREKYVCMTRLRPGIPKGESLSIQHFSKVQHARVKSIEQSHMDIDKALQSKGAGREVVLEIAHFVALPSLLATSDLYVTLPRRLASIFNKDNTFKVYELPVELNEAEVTLHWHEYYDQDAGNIWFRTLVSEVVKEFEPI
ncbi:LysR family transcriptional regulator [Burkholderia sp. Ac-20353]|uniref:LysR family transcriptional regulator n=1 Tax=Burkholderia sp. Ac-20353 TaxID=2703894 RepID=UPI00197B07D8|nr:LysR family transcriptional regulator [Burkholderia sp. Ac-20353]